MVFDLFNCRLNKAIKVGGIKRSDICPSINQGPIETTHSIGNQGDPQAPISSGPLQAVTVRAPAPGLPLHRQSLRLPLPLSFPIAAGIQI